MESDFLLYINDTNGIISISSSTTTLSFITSSLPYKSLLVMIRTIALWTAIRDIDKDENDEET